jgi:hypothetical protein
MADRQSQRLILLLELEPVDRAVVADLVDADELDFLPALLAKEYRVDRLLRGLRSRGGRTRSDEGADVERYELALSLGGVDRHAGGEKFERNRDDGQNGFEGRSNAREEWFERTSPRMRPARPSA